MRQTSVSIGRFDPRQHNPGTRGADSRCSWTEFCEATPRYTAVVDYRDTDQRRTFALCEEHKRRVEVVYGL